ERDKDKNPDKDTVTLRTFDLGTGVKLAEAFATGRVLRDVAPNNGLNRQTQRTAQYETYRVLDLPWLKADAPPPAWAATVKRLTYRGQQRPLDNPANVTPLSAEVTFEERGLDWAVATVTTAVGDAAPVKTRHVQGPASLDGYWMSPDVLRNLK